LLARGWSGYQPERCHSGLCHQRAKGRLAVADS